jgi:hypothetical protein
MALGGAHVNQTALALDIFNGQPTTFAQAQAAGID